MRFNKQRVIIEAEKLEKWYRVLTTVTVLKSIRINMKIKGLENRNEDRRRLCSSSYL
jgi:hypothetical protein